MPPGPEAMGRMFCDSENEQVMNKNISIDPAKCRIHSHGLCTF
jgi:hypothetical protein